MVVVSPEDIENESSLCPAQHVHRVSDGYLDPRKALRAEETVPGELVKTCPLPLPS